jgi:hypothetical protein
MEIIVETGEDGNKCEGFSRCLEVLAIDKFHFIGCRFLLLPGINFRWRFFLWFLERDPKHENLRFSICLSASVLVSKYIWIIHTFAGSIYSGILLFDC